ncbi:uncharacterized protein LOC102801671 [Saccoglossus kowalevskii]|uniref:Uncharacterized protein LOC102801671 n=1 Tax=Saccoglossus kowalevskii TaxID=10224 RepID=A0ABM0M9U5_SACKO|nr:PREDICTED: uncharacterized protein LOC102801671 [Saccoglossus kowalevskii]
MTHYWHRSKRPSPHRTAQTTTASSTTETEQRTPRTTHDAHRDIIKKPKRPIIITKRTIAQTKTLKAVYSNTSFTKQRQTRILKQLEDIELKDAEEYNQKIVEKEKVVRDKRAKQRQALKRLRNKFDEEQVQRFKTQYVTWKSVEHERRGRRSEMYGLPETLDDEELTKLIVKKKKESTGKKFKQPGTREQILRKYVHVVNPKVGSEHDIDQFKTSNNNVILEGINTVELANKDNPSGKKTNVRTVIGSAKRMLSVHSDMDAISEVSSIRDEDTANEDSDYIFSDSGP